MNFDFPKLPKNFFWRLKSDSWGYIFVEIRVKNRLWGSHRVHYAVVLPHPTLDEAVRRGVRGAMCDFVEHTQKIAALKEFEEIEGDYK